MRARYVFLLAMALGIDRSAHAQSPIVDHAITLSTRQLSTVESGQPVAMLQSTSVQRDLVVAGVIAVDVSRAVLVDRIHGFDTSTRSTTRTHMGVFSTPAVPTDVGELVLSNDDVKELRACHPSACNFKLPASNMTYLATKMDWSAPNAVADALRYAREQMATYVNDYRARGADAMVVYDDNGGVKSSVALAELAGESPFAAYAAPALQRSVSDIVFWSRDELPRSRPILGIRQMSQYAPAENNATYIVTRQLWADHYLDASEEVMAVIDRPGGAYVVVQRLYRFDNLPNSRIYSIRNRVADGLRDQLEADLRRLVAPHP